MLKCFLFVILTSFAECYSCLMAGHYHPCKCNTVLGPETITCRTIEDAAEVYKGLNGKVDNSINSLIEDDESESIGEKIFGDVPVEHAKFDMKKLKYLSNSSFNGQEDTMERLDFLTLNLEYIPYQGQMRNLKDFRFGHNKAVTIVKKSWFSGIQNGKVLQKLDLSWNKIQSIENYAFSELVALRKLHLEQNRLSALDSSIIATNVPIEDFRISYNRLTELPIDFIKLLPQEAELEIITNKITNISTEALEVFIEKDFYISLKGNPIQCSCEWLPFIKPSSWNEHKKCDEGDFSRKIYTYDFGQFRIHCN